MYMNRVREDYVEILDGYYSKLKKSGYDVHDRLRVLENGILKYAQTVTALDVEFLEEILSEVCKGMESFEGIKRLEDGRGKQVCHHSPNFQPHSLQAES